MSEVKLTPEQNEAIHSSGKNILVSSECWFRKNFCYGSKNCRESQNKELKLIDFHFHIYKKSSKRITDAA